MGKINVQEEDFDLSHELDMVRDGNSDVGAIVSFVGTVRDTKDNSLIQLTLEHYPQMTEKSLAAIADQATKRWRLKDVTIIHRVGSLAVNEQIVLVITCSKHRQSAFAACEFIMDYLKTSAPFWKKEQTTDAENWVEAKDSDHQKLSKWD